MDEFLVSKHQKYFLLCLNSLPAKAQSEDSNKLAIVYFCIQGLDLLGKLQLTFQEKKIYADFLYEHMIIDPNDEIQSFRASQTFKLPLSQNNYDLPNLAATLFALSSLLALESNFSQNLNRHKLMRFVSRLQIQNGPEKGGFKPVLDQEGGQVVGESDLRHCYTALCVRKMLKYDELPLEERINDIDVDLTERYILDRVNFNGGLSSNRYTESHSGLTFCGLGALKLLNYDFSGNETWVANTIRWLVNRQVDYPKTIEAYRDEEYEYWDEDDIGGFNGRENKFGDTCYSWWVTASLKLLGDQYFECVNFGAAEKYLLRKSQSRLMGGFGKDSQSYPDPFHSFLGIASLTLWKGRSGLEYTGENNLTGIDELLVISQALSDFLKQMEWK